MNLKTVEKESEPMNMGEDDNEICNTFDMIIFLDQKNNQMHCIKRDKTVKNRGTVIKCGRLTCISIGRTPLGVLNQCFILNFDFC